ncbi:hypothetical protein ACFLUU_01695 [Chloroflexota bacterium]
MEILEALITRIRRTGVLFIIGIILISYIGLGFLYWQQGAQQEEFTKQITKLTPVLAKPLPDITELQEEQEDAKDALAPMTDSEAIEKLLSIADKSGIDTDNNTGKFIVPPVTNSQKTVGGGSYQLLSFNGISVSGNYTNVMAFITDLDSGETFETMVLTMVELKEVMDKGWAEAQATVNVDIYTKP